MSNQSDSCATTRVREAGGVCSVRFMIVRLGL